MAAPAAASSSSPSPAPARVVDWWQTTVQLKPRARGCHLVQRELLSGATAQALARFRVGMANLFLQHTSASLIINENADSDVPKDMEDALNRLAPENAGYRHDAEGADDMPAHIKAALCGVSLNVPIANGKLALGTWQGVWLCEHRDDGGARRVVITLNGMVDAPAAAAPAAAPAAAASAPAAAAAGDKKAANK